MLIQILNLLILTTIFYIFYIKRDTFSIASNMTEEIPIKEEFNIKYLDMTQGEAPNYKVPIYTLDIPVIKQKELYIATGVKQQSYDVFGKLLKSLLPIKIQNTNGTAENIELISQRSVNFAICQEDVVIDAREGKEPYNKKHENLEFICGLFYEYFILLVDSKKNIKTWQDLKGKKVGFTGKKSGSFQNGIKLARAAGLEPGQDFAYKNVDSTNRLMNLLQDGDFDAVYITSTTKNPYLINISKNLHIKVIGTSGISEAIIKTYFPHARKKYINTNSFQDVLQSTKFIDTFAIRAVLVTNKNDDIDNIYNITKGVFSNITYIKDNMNRYLYSQNRNNSLLDAFIPSDMFDVHKNFTIHEGAKKYYNEIGFIKYEEKN